MQSFLCNVGREGGTYLDYIINNYGIFPENLIFTQAEPEIHNPKFFDIFNENNLIKLFNFGIKSLTTRHVNDWPSNKFVEYNNSFNIDNFPCIDYYINSYDQQLCFHSKLIRPVYLYLLGRPEAI